MKNDKKSERKLKFRFHRHQSNDSLSIDILQAPELSKRFWQEGQGVDHDLAKLLAKVDGITFACEKRMEGGFRIDRAESDNWRRVLPGVRSALKEYYTAQVVEEAPIRRDRKYHTTPAQLEAMSRALDRFPDQ